MSGNKLTVSDTAPLALKTIDFVGSSILTELYLSRNDFTSLIDITPIGDNLFPKLEKLSLSECQNLTDFDINTVRLKNEICPNWKSDSLKPFHTFFYFLNASYGQLIK